MADPPIPPLVAAGTVVVATQTDGLSAHRLRDGRQTWTADVTPSQELEGDAQHVYAAAGTAIHALDIASGRTVWRTELGGAPTAPPLAHAGWVVAAANGELLALRAADGRVIWKAAVGHVEFRPAIDGDLLVVPVRDGRVHALDMPSGGERWNRALGAPPLQPFTIAGRVYVGTAAKMFFALNARSGRIEWNRPVGGALRGRPALDDRHVYFAGMDNVLFALARGSGSVRWREGLTYRPASGPVVLGGLLIVPGSYVQSLPAFIPGSGERAGEMKFPDFLAAPPVVATDGDGRLVIAAVVGSLTSRFRALLLEPSLVPALPVTPLKELPGELVPLPAPLTLG